MVSNSFKKELIKGLKRGFSGPYNPHRYKTNMAPRSYPKDKEINDFYHQYY